MMISSMFLNFLRSIDLLKTEITMDCLPGQRLQQEIWQTPQITS